MKILAISDLHGELPYISKKFDLLLICGDVCPATNHSLDYQKSWFETYFIDWVNTLPFNDEWSKVVMTWGNHDFIGERVKLDELDNLSDRLVILKNDLYTFQYFDSESEETGIKELTIFGTPYCKVFGTWAFMVPDDTLNQKFSQCPENVYIFISHDSPTINGLGTINHGKIYANPVGNRVLDLHIQRVKPKYFFSGHIHTGNHELTDFEGIKMANVSLLDERYFPFYNILEIDV